MASTTATFAGMAEEIKFLKDKGELVVAMHAEDTPPFHMTSENGELIGLDVEIAKEIARLLKIKLRFDRTAKTYDEVIDIVASGKADIGVSTLSYTPRRGLKALFTTPYFTLSRAALINRLSLAEAKNVNLKELLSPTGKKSERPPTFEPSIGILKGTSYERYAHVAFPKTKIVALDSWENLGKQAAEGKLTVFFGDSNDIKLLMYKNPNISIELMPVILKEPDYLYIAYSNQFPSLAAWVDVMIKNNPEFNITYEQLFDKYKHEIKKRA